MRKVWQLISFVTLISALACASNLQGSSTLKPQETAKVYPSPKPKLSGDGKLTLYVPNASWVDIFFESINERAQQVNLASLSVSALSEGDQELRVWSGFGLSTLKGFVLRKHANRWSAHKLSSVYEKGKKDPTIINQTVTEPAMGWDKIWQQLVDKGLLNLPDASAIKCDPGVLDGRSYVVEFSLNHVYRTYEYGNPEFAKCAEAGQMIKIASQIFGEIWGSKNNEP